MLRARSDDDFEVEHTATAKWQKREELVTEVKIGSELSTKHLTSE